jgi:putative hemolysin
VLSRASRHLISLQIGELLSGLAIGICLVELLHSPGFLDSIGTLYPQQPLVPGVLLFGLLVFLIVALGLVSVTVAKSISYAVPEKVLSWILLPLVFVNRLLKPFTLIPVVVSTKLLSYFNLNLPTERELAVSAEELSEIVERSSEAGEIQDEERDLFRGVVEFSDTLVREVMTPRADIAFVKEGAGLEEIKSAFIDNGFSRLLVVGDDLDTVRGILIAKDLIPLAGQDASEFEIEALLRPAHFISVLQPVDEVLRELQREATHLAVLLDEHGGVDGIVTIEDLIEEIVGEIFDEFDSPEDEEEVQHTKAGELLVDGGMLIDDLNEMHDFDFPSGEYDTLAGFVIDKLGCIPEVGEMLVYDGVHLQVEEVSQSRVTLLRISQQMESSPSGSEAA